MSFDAMRLISLAAVAMFSSPAVGQVLIDFENLGLLEQDPVGTIGIATLDAEAAIQGDPRFAFASPTYGNDTGDSPPFDSTGNTFITSIGGQSGTQSPKTITIDFSQSVSQLSLRVCDVDSNGTAQDRLTAQVFGDSNNLLGTMVLTAPVAAGDDGIVKLIDFGATQGIHKLELSIENIGSAVTTVGWGVDDVQFTPERIVPGLGPGPLAAVGMLVASAGVVALRARAVRKRRSAESSAAWR